MTDGAALRAAVRADPDNDLPRLVYADWLDDRGDPEGEFIRVQVEAARLVVAGYPCFHSLSRPPGCQVCDLRRRAGELWDGGLGDRFAAVFPLAGHTCREQLLGNVRGEWVGSPTPGVCLYYHRGFAHGMKVPLLFLTGGPCPDCRRPGRLCRYCHGTTRAESLAAKAVARYPLDTIALADRAPYWNGAAFCWFSNDRPRPSSAGVGQSELPWELFSRLANYRVYDTRVEGRYYGYATRAQAEAAASVASLQLARELAAKASLSAE